jgi:DNA-binding IclR family transcriptional regulator
MGLVEQHPESGLYDLGAFALDLGLSALARLEPVTLAAPALTQLREATGQTVALAVWANHGATMVRWLSADTPVAASLRVGSVMPLTRSATGRVFLTFLPRPTTERWVKAELADHARKNILPATHEQVDQIIKSTTRQGFAYTNDFIPGIAGIAAPVFDHSGELSLALVALGYSKPFDAALDGISAAILQQARILSQRLGWKPRS